MNRSERFNLVTEAGFTLPLLFNRPVYADFGSILSVGGSLLGSAITSDASEDAVQAQTDSTDLATAEKARQYDLTRTDLLDQYADTRKDYAPYRKTGEAANKRLSKLLGLDEGGESTGEKRMYGDEALTLDEYKDKFNQPEGGEWSADELANIESLYKTLEKSDAVDKEEGSLLRKFSKQDLLDDPVLGGITEADADVNVSKRFEKSDLEADPVYQSGLEFGKKEGEDAINARALATGGYDSGAALKALTRFANDYGSTKADESFDRYNTDMDRIYNKRNDSYNRYNTDNTNTYNRLAGVSGAGQTATNSVTTAGTSATNKLADVGTETSTKTADLDVDAGNARSAGIVSSANSTATGLKNAYSGTSKLWDTGKTNDSNYDASGTYKPYYSFSSDLYGKDGGLLVGPKHEAGGINLEAEGGEVLIPADVVKKKGLRFFAKLIAENR